MKEKLKELWEKVKDKASDIWGAVSEKATTLWAEKKVLIVASTGGLIIAAILISSIVRTMSLAPKSETAKMDAQVEELAIDDSNEKPETVVKEEKKKDVSDKDKEKKKPEKEVEEDDEDDEEEVDEETEKKEFEFVELKDFKDVKVVQKVYSDLNVMEGNHAMEVSTDDFYLVQTKNGQGLLDSKGNWVLKPEYKSITYTNKGYIVSKDDKFFLVKDNKINEVTNNYLTYKVTDEEAKGCGWNTDYGTLSLLAIDKNEIIDFKYKQSKPLAVLAVKISGEAYDVDGVTMSEYTIDKNNKFAIVNGNKCLTGFDYDNAGAYSEGLLAVEKNGKWGYVDEKGKLIIECKYDPVRSAYSTALDKSVDFAPSCTGGYVTVCKKGKYAVLDKEGKIAVPYGRYTYISEVTDGRCYVLSDGKWGIISVNGKKILGTLQKNKYSLSSGGVLDADPPEDIDDEDKDKEDEETDENKDKDKEKDKSVSANNAIMQDLTPLSWFEDDDMTVSENSDALETEASSLLAPATYANVLSVLDQYNPDAAHIIRTTCNKSGENACMRWYKSGDTVLSSLNTAVHEQCHSYTFVGWDKKIYLGNGKGEILVPVTETIPSQIMAQTIPSDLRTFRYETYVGSPSPNLDSNVNGPYGLLNEFNAYHWGLETSMSLADACAEQGFTSSLYRKFLSDAGNDVQAFAEFRYYTLHYLYYAKQNNPDIYREIMANEKYTTAFTSVEKRFQDLVNQYINRVNLAVAQGGGRYVSSTADFYLDEYRKLMAEMEKPQYIAIFQEMGGASGTPGSPVTPKPSDEKQVRAFVERMYTVALNRDAEEAGAADWTNRLVSGQIDGAGISTGFIYSQEFKNRNLNNNDYVDVLYHTFFNREPDAGGKADWMQQLDTGFSRLYVLSGFVNSKEFSDLCNSYGISRGELSAKKVNEKLVKQYVLRMYTKALNRAGEDAGVNDWTDRIVSGAMSAEDVAKSFFFSAEFKNKNLSDADYVETLYRTFMNRNSDFGGKATWMTRLKNGSGRADVLEGFSRSTEFGNLMASYGL